MKLVIFDFEGTLVDFQWQLGAALDRLSPLLDNCIALAGLDREVIARLDYCRLYNYLSNNIVDPGLAAEVLTSVHEVYDYYDADAAKRWSLYPEVIDLLATLNEAGWGVALDSNVGRRALDRMLDQFSLQHCFDITVSRNEVLLLKPESEGIELIMSFYRQRGSNIEEVFMVGDSVTDIETARNANIKVAILTNGEDRTSRLRTHRPDHLIENLSELKKIFFLPESV
jgi:HAD superfamily hydrolase (TIGR01549 family)